MFNKPCNRRLTFQTQTCWYIMIKNKPPWWSWAVKPGQSLPFTVSMLIWLNITCSQKIFSIFYIKVHVVRIIIVWVCLSYLGVCWMIFLLPELLLWMCAISVSDLLTMSWLGWTLLYSKITRFLFTLLLETQDSVDPYVPCGLLKCLVVTHNGVFMTYGYLLQEIAWSSHTWW